MDCELSVGDLELHPVFQSRLKYDPVTMQFGKVHIFRK